MERPKKRDNMATDWPDALQPLTGYTWSSRPSPPPWTPTSCTRCASLPQPDSEKARVKTTREQVWKWCLSGSYKSEISGQLHNNHLAIAVRLASLDHFISRAEQFKAMLLASVCHISYLPKKVQNLFTPLMLWKIQMLLTEMFSRGIIPLGSLSVVNSK